MELDEIKQLLELLRDTDITELQVERDGAKIRIKREKFLSSIEISQPRRPIQAEAKEEEIQRFITVTSPIVGTFYRGSAPEGFPFVEMGSTVKKGQVLCIIEAMKLMNEIESEIDGIIAKILVENGQPVEYGEPLFLIEPLS
ncbi:MAG TPA: acetyl-CoA carboxylase biotin carboxyl carrier protein [Nitrospiraceae bacterium]|nr:acetyl-CoA carboxylase biotin carboxyl carrier protein [Nitrospiraceae bacterium]